MDRSVNGLTYYCGLSATPEQRTRAIRTAVKLFATLNATEPTRILIHADDSAGIPDQIDGIAVVAGEGTLRGHAWVGLTPNP